MTANHLDALIQAAAKWAVFYARKAPAPLFATPCFYFALDEKGLPDSECVHYVQQGDALHAPPEAILRRATHLKRRSTTRTVVAVYALGADGDIHTDPQAPTQLLVYTFVPNKAGQPVFERRVVRPGEKGQDILPDGPLPIDCRFALKLAEKPAITQPQEAAPAAWPQPSATLH